MFGSNILLPLIAMLAGGAFGQMIWHSNGWLWGGAIGLGVGCGVLGLIFLLFALLRRL